MNNINLTQKERAIKKWSPILESLGVTDNSKKEWMSEMAEIHSYNTLNENVAYANQGNMAGMGAYLSTPAPSTIGVPGSAGSDIGASLIPVAMKIAAYTIGLDLVATKPTSSPVIDLPFIDFKYDDTPSTGDEKLVHFKMNCANLSAVKTMINTALGTAGAIVNLSGVSKRVWFHISSSTSDDLGTAYTITTEPTGSKAGWLEFLGYSFTDGLPMFRSYTQNNTSTSGGWTFDATKNTFSATSGSMVTFLNSASIELPADGIYTNGQAFGTVGASDVITISALEDNLIGFVSGGKRGTMDRNEDDAYYPGEIGITYSVRRLTVGTQEVSARAKRTEIEDIKAQTGLDVYQKLESILINESSQKISREIVERIFKLGDDHRAFAPAGVVANISDCKVFDFDVTSYMASATVPGGETSHAVQRKLITRIKRASNFIKQQGRIGGATFLVTNSTLAGVLEDVSGYTLNPANITNVEENGLYPSCKVNGIQVYVDPYMTQTDNRIVIGRKNKVDEPGLVFVPYIMAQKLEIISEASRTPRIFLRSRYAVAELGFFPYKQYLTLKVYDLNNVLA